MLLVNSTGLSCRQIDELLVAGTQLASVERKPNKENDIESGSMESELLITEEEPRRGNNETRGMNVHIKRQHEILFFSFNLHQSC